jgi:hypothetical protein
VRERLRDLYEFEQQSEIETPEQHHLAVWTIKAA